MKRIAISLGILTSLAFSQVAHAIPATTTLADTSLNWAGWAADTNNNVDPFGSPDIVSTSVTRDAFQLQNITFNLGTSNFDVRSGDLFIDAGSDMTWDYVVRSLGTTLNGSKNLNLYSINVGVTDENAYTMSSYYSAPPTSYRSGLPVGLLSTPSSNPIGQVAYSANSSKISFDFGSLSPLFFEDRDFIIGYAVTCANDVVYQQVPVPEPGTVVLLGAGLLGLGIYGRRRAKK